jgi:hypothetical protein
MVLLVRLGTRRGFVVLPAATSLIALVEERKKEESLSAVVELFLVLALRGEGVGEP